MNKPTILMIPTWYPTKDNPFSGCFFREQAIAMEQNFNFVVMTCHHKSELAFVFFVKKIFGLNRPKVTFIQDDMGLKEYSLEFYRPQFVVWDLFIERFNKIVLHKTYRPGVGRIEPKGKKQNRYYVADYLKRKELLPHFDCVYSLTAQDFAPIGQAFARTFNVPHVTAEHAPFPWPGTTLSDSAVDAIEDADKFLAISNDKIRQVLLQNVHVVPYYVGNLVDETKFMVTQKHNDVPVFLIVAANNFYKNLPMFLESMEELKRIAVKPFKVLIAGYNANKGYSQNAKDLEDSVSNSIIAENTQMIQAVSREEMPALYNSCDIFVMTSIQEGLPVSAIEASMSGLPVFSTHGLHIAQMGILI